MSSFKDRFNNTKLPVRANRLVTVGRVEDLPAGRGATIELEGGKELALYNVSGEFYAIENFCPHRGAPLADGRLCGHTVTCDLHNWRFDVRTGACLGKFDGKVESYKVIVEDGMIKIEI